MTGWDIVKVPTGRIHVMPLDDLRPHVASDTCWCHPSEDDEEPINEQLLIHHALDRREDFENGKVRLS